MGETTIFDNLHFSFPIYFPPQRIILCTTVKVIHISLNKKLAFENVRYFQFVLFSVGLTKARAKI